MTHVLYAKATTPSTDPRHWIIEPLAFPTRFKGWPARLEGGRTVTESERKALGTPEALAGIQAAASAIYDMLSQPVDLAQAEFYAIEQPAYLRRRETERAAREEYERLTAPARDRATAAARQRWETVLSVLPPSC